MGPASYRHRYLPHVARPARNTILWGAGALLVGGLIAGIVALFSFSSGGSAVAPNQVTLATAPAPPQGAVVLAEESGTRAVALAVQRKALTATVLDPNGDPESGLNLSFRVAGSSLPARSCGLGCYRATVATTPRRVEVVLPSGTASFRIPASTRAGTAIVHRAARVFRDLRSLVYLESLRSGPTGGLLTTWRMSAPDRLSYQIRGGASAVVIGGRRWDRARPGAKWVESQSTSLQVPAPTWSSDATNAHVLGSATVNGRPVWIVSFVTPSVPAWFTAWIDKSDYRTLQLKMTAPAHFMFHRYTQFNGPVAIVPPVARGRQ
jgi:hypothetical protein